MLLGERFDRLPFVCQPVPQRFLLDPPWVRKPEFTETTPVLSMLLRTPLILRSSCGNRDTISFKTT
jgi:hypothetical protein